MPDTGPFFDREVETLTRDSLHELQGSRLSALLDDVVGGNRFYTEKLGSAGVNPADIRGVEDLPRLPLTTKAELAAAAEAAPPFGTNVTLPEAAYTRVHQTSGTTGKPLKVVDTEETWDWWGRCWGFVLAGAGLTAEDRLFLPFSFGPFIGFWAAVEGAKQLGVMMVPGGGAGSVERLHRMADQGVTAMCCTPTYALRLAEVARGEGVDIERLPLKTIITAGEPGANIPEVKQRIESAWGVRCYDHAGASEVGAHSFECRPQPGAIHPIESEFIVEVLDVDTHQPLPSGEEGELVITNLGRAGFPAIRYRTGDLVRLNTDPCVCGRTFARFEGGVLARADDMVIVRGVNLFPAAIEGMVRRVEAVEEYQITVGAQGELARLSITIEVRPAADPEEARADVASEVQKSLGMKPEVTVAAADSLPRFELKAKRFHVAD